MLSPKNTPASPLATKEDLLQLIRDVARRIGETPSKATFARQTHLSIEGFRRFYATWNDAVADAGLTPHTKWFGLPDQALFQDWAAVVRKLNTLPTNNQYALEGNYDRRCFVRFGYWDNVPARFQLWAAQDPQWHDILDIITRTQRDRDVRNRPVPPRRQGRPKHRASRPTPDIIFGDLLSFRTLLCEPTEEAGVVFAFALVAHDLGFQVEALRARFPDCIARRRLRSGRWQPLRIEFEFESRNFRDHCHPPEACDLIICWRHNWPQCPIEVLELSEVIRQLTHPKRQSRASIAPVNLPQVSPPLDIPAPTEESPQTPPPSSQAPGDTA